MLDSVDDEVLREPTRAKSHCQESTIRAPKRRHIFEHMPESASDRVYFLKRTNDLSVCHILKQRMLIV